MPQLLYKPLDWYWQIIYDVNNVWSSSRFIYVPTSDSQYQAFLSAGGSLNILASTNELNNVISTQVIPPFLSKGVAIQCHSNSGLNSIYALDNVTLNQVGAIARDSACGLGFPLGYATYAYPDIYGTLQTFNAPQFQGLYTALRDYTAGVCAAVNALINKQNASLPTQPVIIP